jgi:anti-sigma factor RsiW
MTSMCDDLVGFIDGELEPERAEAFREHLRSCADCQSGLAETLQMSVRLSELTPTPAQALPGLADPRRVRS